MGDHSVIDFFTGTGFTTIFSYLYGCLIIWTVVTSLAGPLDKAMGYFRFISAIFSVLTLTSLVGIFMFLSATPFWDTEKDLETDKQGNTKWVDKGGELHFSYLKMAGCIMFTVFIMPMLLRPIDFMN